MNLLVIAPLPIPPASGESAPPVTGNTLPVVVMMDSFRKNRHNVVEININQGSLTSGFFTFSRAFHVIRAAWQTYRLKKESDLIYLTVAESLVGNLRDIAMYISCWGKLDRMVIHMLGGARMRQILTPSNRWQFKINRFFISRLAGVIVEGQAQFDTFSNVIDKRKIHIIPNFAEEYLFNNSEKTIEKFKNINPLRVLFLSNLLPGKGHDELLEAYKALSPVNQSKVQLDFAGGFETEAQKQLFIGKISVFPNIEYHGAVKGEVKKQLYHSAHIFCLPTYYPYEGQPFCIIEAYAGGCMVITTNHSGISQIFSDNVNGYEVKKESVEDLSKVLTRLIEEPHHIERFGISNLDVSLQKYTSKEYLSKIQRVFNAVIEEN